MKRFAQLFREIDETTRTTNKVRAIAEYFSTADNKDSVWAVALLSHRRPRRTVNTRLLREWAAEEADIPLWLFEETYHVVGDLAETMALMVPDHGSSDYSLAYWVAGIIELGDKDEETKKEFIRYAWHRLNAAERLIFNKIITGGFRIGVSQKIMVKGLAQATGINENVLAYQLMGDWDPSTTTFEQLIYPEDHQKDLSKPYPFFLAYALEKEPEELGKPEDWQAEYKWDGIRGQLIKREGELFLWSRGEELILDKFPEFGELVKFIADGTVIDGEILIWKNDGVQPFNSLQTRIGRKNISDKMLREIPAILMAYDLMEFHGHDIRDLSLEERRRRLESIVKSADAGLLKISEAITFRNWNDLVSIREQARERGAEGLMLKKISSPYEVGRKKGNWWKWKVDPFTVDAVLTYAMRGHGRRANLYTDYTFGLWHEGELVTFAKAYSGLSDEEIREVDRFVKGNTLERFGPVRQVQPKLVFELAFEGIAKSSRHKSGFAVRFPRIHRWRRDKIPGEANTLSDLEQLAKLYLPNE